MRKTSLKKQRKKFKNSQKGITLVALVVTVVILIILATVSVSVIFGENGLIKMAERAKNLYEDSQTREEGILENYANRLNGVTQGESGGGDTNTETPPPTPPTEYNDETLPSAPSVSEGMQRVKWDEATSTWKKAEATEEWYNYANKEWANVVLGDATWKEDGTLDEEAPYTQLVWIPRYAYKINSMYHQAGTYNSSTNSYTAGTIDIKFIDTSDKDTGGTTYQSTYPTVTTGTENKMDDYVVHPAFNYGTTKLPGFWVGKYESSHTGCTTTESTGRGNSGNAMTVKAGVTSWRSTTIGDMFQACVELNKDENVYGLGGDSEVDPHLMKNSEWGAVAYLSKSVYGKNDEIWINPNSSYITGQAESSVYASSTTSTTDYKSTNGKNASTTGNTTGIYDMSGGAWEYVAAYRDGASSTYAGTMLQADAKYVEKYPTSYTSCDPTNGGKYGDAVYETSSSVSSPWTNSWYSDDSDFPNSSNPFFIRGGSYGSTSDAGAFCFNVGSGNVNDGSGFRVVVPVLK